MAPAPKAAPAPPRAGSKAHRHAANHRKKQHESRRQERQTKARQARISDLEGRIADREQVVQELEMQMGRPDFYTDKAAARATITRHQGLMWEVGDLMNQWEALQGETGEI